MRFLLSLKNSSHHHTCTFPVPPILPMQFIMVWFGGIHKTKSTLFTARSLYPKSDLPFLYNITFLLELIINHFACLAFYLLITYSTPNTPHVTQVLRHSNNISFSLSILPSQSSFPRRLQTIAKLDWFSLGFCVAATL